MILDLPGASPSEAATMSGRVHSAGQSTYYDETVRRKVAGQAFSHSESVGGGVPGPDHRNAETLQHIEAAANIQGSWWIVDFAQLGRIFAGIKRDDVSASG
jgi:hypothetical protein